MFCAKLKALRINRGLNKRQMSEMLDMPYTTYNNYETGTREPNSNVLIKIANEFNVSTDFLIGNEQELPSNAIMPTGMVPVLGRIPAGMPIFAEENIEGYMPVMVKNPQNYFYLRVIGDSMIDAGIQDGSLVLIHKQPCAENGEIVACRVNGNEATLKRFTQSGNTVVLMPANAQYSPIVVSCVDFENGDAEIIGVAKQVMNSL